MRSSGNGANHSLRWQNGDAPDQVLAAFPAGSAHGEKLEGLTDVLVWRPYEETSDFGILRVLLENARGIVGSKFAQEESGGPE